MSKYKRQKRCGEGGSRAQVEHSLTCAKMWFSPQHCRGKCIKRQTVHMNECCSSFYPSYPVRRHTPIKNSLREKGLLWFTVQGHTVLSWCGNQGSRSLKQLVMSHPVMSHPQTGSRQLSFSHTVIREWFCPQWAVFSPQSSRQLNTSHQNPPLPTTPNPMVGFPGPKQCRGFGGSDGSLM